MRLNSVFIVLGLAAAVCAMPMPAAEGGATPGATGTGTADVATDGAPKTGASSKTAAHGELVTKIAKIRYEKRDGKGGGKKEKNGSGNKDHKESRATPETPAPDGAPAPGGTSGAATPDPAKGHTDTESKDSTNDPDHAAKKEAAEKFLQSAAKQSPKLGWKPEHLEFEWEGAGAAGKGSGAPLETRESTGKPKKDEGKKEKGKEHELMIDISFEAGHVCEGRCHAHIKAGKDKKITGSIFSEKKNVQLFSGAAK